MTDPCPLLGLCGRDEVAQHPLHVGRLSGPGPGHSSEKMELKWDAAGRQEAPDYVQEN